jgi:hypothetical protein
MKNAAPETAQQKKRHSSFYLFLFNNGGRNVTRHPARITPIIANGGQNRTARIIPSTLMMRSAATIFPDV